MNHVLYYSMTGNTKKMAAAIAEELGVVAKDARKETALPADGLLFIGSGSYGDKPGEELAKLIEKSDLKGRKVALFGTSGRGAGLEVASMAALLEGRGATVVGRYHAKGKAFVVVNLGHPDKGELEGARAFAREMARQAGQ